MITQNKYLIGAAVLVAFGSAVCGYGRYQYSQGITDTQIKQQLEIAALNEQMRLKELEKQKQLEKVRNEAYEQKQISDAAIASAADDINRLRSTIADQKRLLKKPSTPSRVDGNSAACWVVLNEAIGRYQEVARDADKLVERLRVGQGWAQAIQQ